MRESAFWISGVTAIGRGKEIKKMPDIMKEQQKSMRVKWIE